jgi:hypothetical protein
VVRFLRPLPERFALAGILGVGFSWSLGVAWLRWPDVQASGLPLHQVALLVLAGGMATVLSLWFGVSAVMWAMCRVCGHRASFASILRRLSASALALWIAAPALAFLSTVDSVRAPLLLWLVVAGGAATFCAQLIVGLCEVAGLSMRKSSGCVALTAMFCASFFFLYQ